MRLKNNIYIYIYLFKCREEAGRFHDFSDSSHKKTDFTGSLLLISSTAGKIHSTLAPPFRLAREIGQVPAHAHHVNQVS